MTELRQRILDAVVLRWIVKRTRRSYVNTVKALVKHYRCSPERVEQYLPSRGVQCGPHRCVPRLLVHVLDRHMLLGLAEHALQRPGLSHQAVYGSSPAAVAYSAYPQDPTKVVRISADGKRTIGRLVGWTFKAIP